MTAEAVEHPAVPMRRRRHAAERSPRLECLRRDPLDPLPLGDVDASELAAWRAAWSHLAAHGYAVDVPAQVVAAGERERFTAGAS